MCESEKTSLKATADRKEGTRKNYSSQWVRNKAKAGMSRHKQDELGEGVKFPTAFNVLHDVPRIEWVNMTGFRVRK